MTSTRGLFMAALILLAVSGLEAEGKKSLSRFEVGGGLRLLMPQQDFTSGWGLGVNLSFEQGTSRKSLPGIPRRW